MNRIRKNIALLATCQALLQTNNATVIALNGLVGYALASDKSLATLPVTAWAVGAALTTYAASALMKRLGRRAGFTLGAGVGIVGALVCAIAIHLGQFGLFCVGALVLGVYNAFGQYYRFAAADSAPADLRSRAISYTLVGGLVGGIVGPTLSRVTRTMLATDFLGAYLVLILFMLAAIIALRGLDIPAPSVVEAHARGRPLSVIARQPAFIVAVLAAALGYGVMNFLMTATPLAMGICGHPYGAAATAISLHVIGMYAPSFFTGSLIRRFGVLQVMAAGVVLNLGCVAIALAGVDVANFWAALILLGMGWNFLYIGGTTLLTEVYRPEERNKVQGVNDSVIFITTASGSFLSGVMLGSGGWALLNHLALLAVAVVAAALLWLAAQRRRAVGAG